VDALRRVADGGSALDPEVVSLLLSPLRSTDQLATLTPREREVLALMAEGRTNRGIARRLWLTERTIETHIASILAKLGIGGDEEDHRRVLAVLAFLNHRRVQRPEETTMRGRHTRRSGSGCHSSISLSIEDVPSCRLQKSIP
jgi:DNA-binding NarL/FixJ family response regulator